MELVFVIDGVEDGTVCLPIVAIKQYAADEHPDYRGVPAALARSIYWEVVAMFIVGFR